MFKHNLIPSAGHSGQCISETNVGFAFDRSEVAAAGPSFFGKVKTFCREKGHGFIIPKEEGDLIFVHISE